MSTTRPPYIDKTIAVCLDYNIGLCKQAYNPILSSIDGFTDITKYELTKDDRIEDVIAIPVKLNPTDEVIKLYYKSTLKVIDDNNMLVRFVVADYDVAPMEYLALPMAILIDPTGNLVTNYPLVNSERFIYLPVGQGSWIYDVMLSKEQPINTVIADSTLVDNEVYITPISIKKVKYVISPYSELELGVANIITNRVDIHKYTTMDNLIGSINPVLLKRLKNVFINKKITELTKLIF